MIPAHDAAATLGEQLDALVTQRPPTAWEIVVADNGSTDATPDVVTGAGAAVGPAGPVVRLVRADGGRGPAYARNAGARAARGRLLAFCDADDVVAPGWAAAMVEGLRLHEFVCGPVDLDRLNPAWLAGSRGSTGTTDVARFETRFPFASSCNLGIRRERFDALGGFDESLTVGEDIDLSMRLHLAGVELAYLPDALVHYRYRPTLGETFRRAVAYGASTPVLAERWRARTGAPLPRAAHARNWLWLVRHAGLVRDRAGRARWLWVAGGRLGTLRGAVRVRRPYV